MNVSLEVLLASLVLVACGGQESPPAANDYATEFVGSYQGTSSWLSPHQTAPGFYGDVTTTTVLSFVVTEVAPNFLNITAQSGNANVTCTGSYQSEAKLSKAFLQYANPDYVCQVVNDPICGSYTLTARAPPGYFGQGNLIPGLRQNPDVLTLYLWQDFTSSGSTVAACNGVAVDVPWQLTKQ